MICPLLLTGPTTVRPTPSTKVSPLPAPIVCRPRIVGTALPGLPSETGPLNVPLSVAALTVPASPLTPPVCSVSAPVPDPAVSDPPPRVSSAVSVIPSELPAAIVWTAPKTSSGTPLRRKKLPVVAKPPSALIAFRSGRLADAAGSAAFGPVKTAAMSVPPV